jgi:hypothetical protein
MPFCHRLLKRGKCPIGKGREGVMRYRREMWVVEVVEHGQWLPAIRECYARHEGKAAALRSASGLRKGGVRARVKLYIAQDRAEQAT